MKEIRCEVSSTLSVKFVVRLPADEFYSLTEWTAMVMVAVLRELLKATSPREWDAVERHAAKLKTAILKALEKEFPTA